MKFIAKKYYTFAELQARWECEQNDLVQAVIDGELVPSIYVAHGKYGVHQFEFEYDEEARTSVLWPAPVFEDDFATSSGKGFFYLVGPGRKDAADCEFGFFADKATDLAEGDVFYELASRVDVEHILKHGVFMSDEVARVEATSNDKSTLQAADKPLSKRERDTLLTIIAVLCKEAGVDYKMAAKSANMLLNTATSMGVSIGETTIEEHLKKIPNALGTRSR